MNIRKFKWILAFAGAVVVVLLLRGFAFTSCLIPSTGMENSIFQGERILVNKWSYGLRVPFMSLFSYHRWCESPVRRQEIVVFNNPAGIRNLSSTAGKSISAVVSEFREIRCWSILFSPLFLRRHSLIRIRKDFIRTPLQKKI